MPAAIAFEGIKPDFVLTVHTKNTIVICLSSQSISLAPILNILLTCQTKTTDKI